MGARYEQVEPHIGIVRAPLAANLTFDSNGEFGPKAVSLDANGRVVVGTAGQSGFAGVLVKNVPVVPAGRFSAAQTVNNWMGGRAGDVVDIMTQGQIVARTMMTVTLSCDHRVIDGAVAANFLVTLKSFLEEPAMMLS